MRDKGMKKEILPLGHPDKGNLLSPEGKEETDNKIKPGEIMFTATADNPNHTCEKCGSHDLTSGLATAPESDHNPRGKEHDISQIVILLPGYMFSDIFLKQETPPCHQ
jgi:hypothetical protein